MAFDINDPLDLIKLRDEQLLDPVSMGYSLVDGQTKNILELFNAPEKNVQQKQVNKKLTTELLLSSLVVEDLVIGKKFTQESNTWLTYFFSSVTDLHEEIEQHKSKILEMFNYSPTPQTFTNLNSSQRGVSRAEVLFGEDAIISKQQWIAARNYKG